MLTTAPPIEVYQRDSVRVENRGPSITTIAPPSVTPSACVRAVWSTVSRPTGQYGSAKFTWTAPVS
jgi:hypothetical protein